jgi:hypothetical protein
MTGWSPTGRSGLSSLAGVGERLRMLSKTAAGVAPGKARSPVAISWIKAPNEKRSDRWSTSSPRACSGDT